MKRIKKKKGFTLIELLAVVLILAIIALITAPIVMNIVEKSKVGAAERSAENYIKAVETEIMSRRTSSPAISDGIYTVNSDGDLCLNSGCTSKIEISMSGKKPSSGNVVIVNEQVLFGTVLTIDGYTIVENIDKTVQKTTEPISENKFYHGNIENDSGIDVTYSNGVYTLNGTTDRAVNVWLSQFDPEIEAGKSVKLTTQIISGSLEANNKYIYFSMFNNTNNAYIRNTCAYGVNASRCSFNNGLGTVIKEDPMISGDYMKYGIQAGGAGVVFDNLKLIVKLEEVE